MRILIIALVLFSWTLPASAQESATRLRSSAERLMKRMDGDSLTLTGARTELALWFGRRRNYDQALAQTKELAPVERMAALGWIASFAVSANDKEVADKLLTEAVSVLEGERSEPPDRDVLFLLEIALKNRNVDLGAKFVSFLEEGSDKRSWGLLKLGRAYADSKNVEQAVACTQQALEQVSGFDENEESKKIEIMAEAAKVMVAAGELERAKRIADMAATALLNQAAPRIRDPEHVASALAAVGDTRHAVVILETIEAETEGLSFANLASHFNEAETARLLLARSRESILHTTPDFYSQSNRIAHLVDAYVKNKLVDEALELLPRITDAFSLHSSAITIAEVLSKMGRIAEARAVLDMASQKAEKIVSEKSEEISSFSSASLARTKSQMLSSLVENYLALNSPERAERAANAIDQPQFRASALSKAAVGYAVKSERRKARSLLLRALKIASESDEYRHDRSKEQGLFDVILAMNEAGFQSDFVVALSKFLEQLEKSDAADQYVASLFILGDLAESTGVQLNSKMVALLKRIEARDY